MTDQQSPLKRARTRARNIRRTTTCANVRAAIGPLERGCEIYTLTLGQWSLIDLIEHCLEHTGPAACIVSTWTAANADVSYAMRLLADERLTDLRFIVDFSFPSRQPAYCAALREAFGDDSIRVTKNHAKFVTLTNDTWKIAIRTSMNLNENRRTENVEISDDAALAGFLVDFTDDLFRQQTAEQTWSRTPGEHSQHFGAEWNDGDAVEASADEKARYFGDGPTNIDLRRVGLSHRC